MTVPRRRAWVLCCVVFLDCQQTHSSARDTPALPTAAPPIASGPAVAASTPSRAVSLDAKKTVDAASPMASVCPTIQSNQTLEGRIALAQGMDEDGVHRTIVLLELTHPTCVGLVGLENKQIAERRLEVVFPGDRSGPAQQKRWEPWVGQEVRVTGEPWSLVGYMRAYTAVRMMVSKVEQVRHGESAEGK